VLILTYDGEKKEKLKVQKIQLKRFFARTHQYILI